MKNSMLLLFSMFALFIISGCGTSTNGAAPASPPTTPPAGIEEKNDNIGKEAPPASTPPAKSNEEEKSTGAGAVTPPAEQPSATTDRKVNSVDDIKQHLKMDMTQDQVIELLGTKYTEVTNAMEGNMMWRYDLGAKPDYSYQGEMDSVDMEGLINKSLAIQLFIDWSEDQVVNHYSFLYLKDGQIHEYRVFHDGYVKESVVQ